MKNRYIILSAIIAALFVSIGFAQETKVANASSKSAKRSFSWKGETFLLDGKPFIVRSGEMHYPRVPRAYWRERFKMAKAMGLNTIATYVFWNLHEPRPGKFDFTANLDIAEFVREAGQEGLYVIVRPGPYICTEWDFGGIPAWLLN
jgi:beta-galactosidase